MDLCFCSETLVFDIQLFISFSNGSTCCYRIQWPESCHGDCIFVIVVSCDITIRVIAIPVVTSIPMEAVANSQPFFISMNVTSSVPIPPNIEGEVIQEASVVGKVVDCSQPPVLAESIAIPPDPECGNAVADSFESMCIDVEPFDIDGAVICREVQLDLVEVISEMKCQRILSLIVDIALFVCTIGFLVVRKFGAGVACFGLFLVEVLCWLFSYYYSRSLMLTISLSPYGWILTAVFYSPLCWLC